MKQKNFIPTNASSICSVHFRDSDYLHRPGRIFKALKPDAVPTVFLEFPEYYQTTEKKQRSSVSDKLENARTKTKAMAVRSESTSNCDSQDWNPSVHVSTQTCIQFSGIAIPAEEIALQLKEKVSQLEKIVVQLQEKISPLEKKNNFSERRIKVLLQKIRRRDKTISNLQDLLKDLKSKGLIEQEASSVLTSHFGDGVSGKIVVEEEES